MKQHADWLVSLGWRPGLSLSRHGMDKGRWSKGRKASVLEVVE